MSRSPSSWRSRTRPASASAPPLTSRRPPTAAGCSPPAVRSPTFEWGDRTLVTSQCNNLYIFPGVGLGALVAKAPKVTHGMFLAASRALSALVTPAQEAQGYLLPPMARYQGRVAGRGEGRGHRGEGLRARTAARRRQVRGDHRAGAVGAGVYAISAGEGGGLGSEPVRSKKPEGPADVCQKQEEDTQRREVFFWLLASGFYRPPTTNTFTTASVSASDSKTVSAPAARSVSTP